MSGFFQEHLTSMLLEGLTMQETGTMTHADQRFFKRELPAMIEKHGGQNKILPSGLAQTLFSRLTRNSSAATAASASAVAVASSTALDTKSATIELSNPDGSPAESTTIIGNIIQENAPTHDEDYECIGLNKPTPGPHASSP